MAPVLLPVLVPADDPCNHCGVCCGHMVRPPFYRVGDPAWARLLAERPDLAAGIDASYEADRAAGLSVDDERPCLWLDPATLRCRHHGWRPEICRDFEPGEEGCDGHRAGRGLGPVRLEGQS